MATLPPIANIEMVHMAEADPLSDISKDEDEVTTSGATDVGDGAMPANPNDGYVICIQGPQTRRFCGNEISTGKYSLFSFIPAFLFEQFRRYSNCFFLFIALLQQIPEVSPTGRYTTLVPLIFILSVSALKEIVEDYKRHRADDETNDREVEVLKDGHWQWVKWLNVQVGDIAKIQNNNFFPADLILLASSEPQGICFIETANLDGETNLKIRQGLPQTAQMIDKKDLNNFQGTVECEPPNRHLYEFVGVLKQKNVTALPLGPDQMLLRGAMLRNTSWVFALVVYTGHDTKLIKNSTRAPLKRSTVDRLTNVQVVMLFAILLVLAFISALFNELWSRNHHNDWYIGLDDIATRNFGYNLLTFIILYNNLVPISLQVTLEMVRFVQAIFINMDMQMYHAESDTPAMARTSNLNEELGQVKYIFSDKTGTLTRNVMEFKKCAIGGIVYPLADTPEQSELVIHLKEQHANSELIAQFLELLAVCHTVIPEKMDDGTVVYHAASPDERALVYGAGRYGYVFESRTPTSVTINALGEIKTYTILNVLEFTSARKRMSVIVRDPNGAIRLLCKGADTVIYERLAARSQRHAPELLNQLESFATEGLRTLCLAGAEIDTEFFEKWKKMYDKAATSIQFREQKLEDVANLIETNLMLLGATAIEDKLQEDVPETIATLLKANIHIWVLTGDKQETAINIGYACRLIVHDMSLLIVNEDSLDSTRETMQRHAADLGDRLGQENELALVIDGNTLKYALSCELRREFLDVCISCKVVICCRVSPIQKAEVVELVTQHTKAVTLAIGDGANDVAMIQKAHVGVGISGVEGLQAACASDYSIAQFKYLLRLLLVHGAWNYSRMCKLILYSFYKNICLYVIELWFAIYSAWSGQILFERWCIGFYNVFFTALPPFAMGMFDKPCSDDMMIKFPKLYHPSQSAKLFNVKVFWVWMINGLLHAGILYWLPMFMTELGVIWQSGRDGGYLVLGNMVYTYVVVTVCLKAGLVINSWTWPTHVAIWGSILSWFGFLLLYSNVWPTIPIGAVMLGQDKMLLSSVVFWFGLILIPLITLLPDVVFKVILTTICKSETDLVRESEILGTGYHKEPKASLTETARLLKNVKSVFMRRSATRINMEMELSHGYAFSQEEGASVTQTDVIRAYDTNIPKPPGM